MRPHGILRAPRSKISISGDRQSLERFIRLETITRKGRTAAVLVGAEEWQRKTKRVGNLAEFFAASPLRGSGMKVRRLKEQPRKINL